MSILVISDIAPTLDWTGGIALSDLLDTLEPSTPVSVLCLANPHLDYRLSADFGPHNVSVIPKSREYWGRPRGPAGRLVRGAADQTVQSIDGYSRKRVVRALVERTQPSVLLVVAESQSVLSMTPWLPSLGVPIVSVHWDLAEWWAFEHGLPPSRATELTENQASLARASAFTVVPSPEYSRALGVEDKSLVLLPRAPRPKSVASTGEGTPNTINIGMVGQAYSQSSIQLLETALEDRLWRLGGRAVRLHYFGRGGSWPRRAQMHGWRPRAPLVKALSRMDLAFLPYSSPFGGPRTTMTSYPSKLSLYCAARLPVLMLGMDSASVTGHLESYGAGVALPTSAKGPDVVEAMHHIWKERSSFSQGSASMYEGLFSPEVHLNSVTKMWSALGVAHSPAPRFSRPGVSSVWSASGNLGRLVGPPSLYLEKVSAELRAGVRRRFRR